MKKPTLFGKYLLLERINVGGMAEVFTAKAFGVEGFERILAIKKILPTMAEDDEFITMFIDEARISVQLNHANIVHIHELGKHEDTYFIAMEYVSGRDLRTILERYRRRKEIMPTAQAVFLASKICEGLDYAHRKKDARGQDLNIIHRDISPQNILISYEGEVKLIDFGIAKAANRSQKTQAGILKGKFGYMSPEQVRGLPIDRRSDIFAVGVILYEMLTGERLFVGESDFSTLEKVRNAEVPAPRQFNPNIPAGLEKVLMKALSGEADTRYQWGSDLQEDLMRFLLAGDAIYSSKHLSAYMKEVFAEDILREAEKMERYASIERPEQIEATGVTGDMLRASRRPQAGPSLSASTRPTPSSTPSLARAEYESPPEEDEEEPQEEEIGAGEKTQIVDSSFVFRGQEEREKKRPAVVPSGPSESVLVDDSLTGETAYIADSESTQAPSSRNSGKPQVVIGEGEGYAGATVIGPAPTSRPEPEEMEAPNATRVGSVRGTMARPALTGEMPRLDDEEPATFDESSEDERTDAGRDPREEEMTGPIHVPDMEQEEPPEKVAPLPKKTPKPAVQGSRKPPPKVIIAAAAAAAVVLLVVLGAVLFSGPNKGSLMISVQPAGAEVQIDGQAYPQNKVIELPEGVHSLTASSPGYLSAVQEIRVTQGQQPQLISLVLKEETPSAPGTPPADAHAVAATGTGTPSSDAPTEQQAPASAPDETVAGSGTGTGTPPPAAEQPPKPALFSAVFVGEPGGAEVEVGGKRVGKTPDATLANLIVGKTYTFVATRAGYQTYSGEFRSDGEEQIKVSFVLKKEAPPPTADERPSPTKPAIDRPAAKPAKVAAKPQTVAKGKLACSSRPLGAQIWVDGKYSGRDTPAALGNPLVLPVGSHTIVFKLGSQQSKPQKVTITEGDMAKLVNVQLE
ncbi:serine/threonine-protein kinase [Cystobacter ferrugineus]|uniref:non-specific serine/threonine protein kinase n=1 Tax=Cystobacter ferrugineus TaxID=83449 RepID=A0A1L9AUU7_9BACT|nr:serine/threonine-protein kinase [Cystobacter ferrugineus]OJH33795.1 protein kinase [Cystobacter ferrugineus]